MLETQGMADFMLEGQVIESAFGVHRIISGWANPYVSPNRGAIRGIRPRGDFGAHAQITTESQIADIRVVRYSL